MPMRTERDPLLERGVTSAIALDYVVVRCSDLERSRAFYATIGFDPIAEQHGTGAPHFACTIGSIVLELYPAIDAPTSSLRFGVRVADVEAVVSRVRNQGERIVRADLASGPRTAVLLDPDGNTFALSEFARAR